MIAETVADSQGFGVDKVVGQLHLVFKMEMTLNHCLSLTDAHDHLVSSPTQETEHQQTSSLDRESFLFHAVTLAKPSPVGLR